MLDWRMTYQPVVGQWTVSSHGFRSPRALLGAGRLSVALSVLGACGCAEKQDVTIVGEVRDPENGCEPTLVEYKYRKKKAESVPLGTGPDWCAVMGDSEHVTCFLNIHNEEFYYYLTLPRNEDHTAPDRSHPDAECWKEEAATWEDESGGGSLGGAGSQ